VFSILCFLVKEVSVTGEKLNKNSLKIKTKLCFCNYVGSTLPMFQTLAKYIGKPDFIL